MVKFEERESVVLTNRGQKIFGILHRPIGVDNSPVVMVCHGLAGHKTGRYRVYVDLAAKLVQAKIAVLRFDFRGSGDSEGSFDEMTLEGEVSDAIQGLKYLQTVPGLNTDKIGIFGRSLGGAVGILSAAELGSVKSIALWASMYDGEQWKSEWQKVQSGEISEMESQEMRRINGQVPTLGFYAEMFNMPIEKALQNLKNVPLLLIHGEQDTLINISHSEKYIKNRLGSLADTKFIRLPKSDHDFSHTEERIFAIETTTDWFKHTLL